MVGEMVSIMLTARVNDIQPYYEVHGKALANDFAAGSKSRPIGPFMWPVEEMGGSSPRSGKSSGRALTIHWFWARPTISFTLPNPFFLT